nr:MAG TPA: hypothetical protein [Bacteriophage sp.]
MCVDVIITLPFGYVKSFSKIIGGNLPCLFQNV